MIHPLRDQILVDQTTAENISKGGIVLPETRAMGLYAWGVVLSVGSRVKNVRVGDRCRYTKLLAWPLDDGQALIKEDIADLVQDNDVFRPLGNRLLIRTATTKEKSAGGIFLPPSAKQRSHQAVVVAIGNDNGCIQPGDMILYSHAGGEVEIRNNDGDVFSMISIENVLGFESIS